MLLPWNDTSRLPTANNANPACQLRSRPVDNLIDDAVFLGLLRVHDEVPLHVALDAVQRLLGVLGNQVVGNLADAQNLSRVNVDVGGLAAQSAHRGLMNENSRIGQSKALALG